MIRIKTKKEVPTEGIPGYKIVSIVGALQERKLPKEYLNYDPATPAVVGHLPDPKTKECSTLFCWGGVDQEIYGPKCPEQINKKVFYEKEAFEKFLVYLRVATGRLRKINKKLDALREEWQGDTVFEDGIEQ